MRKARLLMNEAIEIKRQIRKTIKEAFKSNMCVSAGIQ